MSAANFAKNCRAGAHGPSSHGLQSACQWRRIVAAAVDSALPRLRRRGARPGSVEAEATRVLGTFLRDVMKLNLGKTKFPAFRSRRNRLQPTGGRL